MNNYRNDIAELFAASRKLEKELESRIADL